jgi:hypothetical protein
VNTAPRSGLPVPRASRALGNLRGFVILLVLAFHSVLAYLNFLPASPFPFDTPPYLWRAFPIVDTERWFGFDLFCAWHALALSQHWLAIADLVPPRCLALRRDDVPLHEGHESRTADRHSSSLAFERSA